MRKALAGMLATALLSLALPPSDPAHAAQDREVRAHEAELRKLRSRLGNLRDELQKDIRKKDRLTARLRDAEKQEAAASAGLVRVRADQASNREERKRLDQRRAEREADLALERGALAGQLRSAFINGRGERLKLLLNQQDPARLGRQMVYYDYLNRARNARIQAVLAHLAEISVLDASLAEVAARLETLEAEGEKELAARSRARRERGEVLAKLEARIEERGEELSRLESEEAALRGLIRDLQALMRDFPVQGEQPFTALKGKLGWPVTGRLANDFGQPRAGDTIRWNGVVVAAGQGDPVRAVARGRVTYADWLPGLGLLVILDHGEGYLSLYGHNDTINRDVGDWVRPGDVIATVGQSGGRQTPGLYFEIRRGTRPENPHRWFAGSLKRR